MDALVLCYRGEPLREFPLGVRPVEVGGGAYCDIVVHDSGVAERELLIRRTGGTVVAYDLRPDRRSKSPRPVPPHAPVALGTHHSLVRVPAEDAGGEATVPSEARTEELECFDRDREQLALVVGRGSEARRLAVGDRPITVGSEDDNDLVLPDRAVSGRHCRVEALEGELLVRDLGSRNGTWVDGLRVVAARMGPGTRLRLGRTDLTVVPGGRGRARPGSDDLVASSPAMLAVLAEVDRYARLPWPVLVRGESGSGKEGIARALHDRGPRSARPFVALNAGGLPGDLIESELFGHERGAFTGAVATHRGVFEQADGGTLFLDEIGELPPSLQARLLRVLETWQVRRVGSESAVRVDVRLVCATHRDLRAMAMNGTFRRDLYYRVTRLAVDVPPLRQRPEDVRALAVHFLKLIEPVVGRRELSEAALARLLGHAWPGNARELRNVVSAAAAATPSGTIQAEDVERALVRIGGPAVGDPNVSLQVIEDVLARHRGNVTAAARALGLPRSTLRDRLRKDRSGDGAQRMTKPA